MSITVDQVIEAYVQTRKEIEDIERECKEKTEKLKQFQTAREQWLDSEMRKQGETSKKTPHGTCFYNTTESVTIADWDSFWDFVVKNQKFELLNHACNKTAALEVMGEDRGNPPPPGVNYVAIKKVVVRKAT